MPQPWDTAFSPDGARIALVSGDLSYTSVKVVDIESGAEVLDLRHRFSVHDVAWSPTVPRSPHPRKAVHTSGTPPQASGGSRRLAIKST